ncbi:hypothetical protein BC936DRAFT_136957 [Jimgerdemannia flammicorona]|uniref:Uncharacterized protein n=1 Tax=Jimgerdemannia flammicorona TaxID=994334 RepID=A0A433CYD6_9FUNG|nr:hypothetical protein BC936DRAFT_136957 [Jimgerdemannia flammicorona]
MNGALFLKEWVIDRGGHTQISEHHDRISMKAAGCAQSMRIHVFGLCWVSSRGPSIRHLPSQIVSTRVWRLRSSMLLRPAHGAGRVFRLFLVEYLSISG